MHHINAAVAFRPECAYVLTRKVCARLLVAAGSVWCVCVFVCVVVVVGGDKRGRRVITLERGRPVRGRPYSRHGSWAGAGTHTRDWHCSILRQVSTN